MEYVCKDCKSCFSTKQAKQPYCCPMCASLNIATITKARKTAMRLIDESNELTKQIDALMSRYTELYCERETKLVTLRVYKGRGIISDAEMPHIKRQNLQAQLSEYRKSHKN